MILIVVYNFNNFISKFGEKNIFDYRQFYVGDIQIAFNFIPYLANFAYTMYFLSRNYLFGPKPGVKVYFSDISAKKILKRHRQSTNMKKELMHACNKSICIVCVSISTKSPINKSPFGPQTGSKNVLFRIFQQKNPKKTPAIN